MSNLPVPGGPPAPPPESWGEVRLRDQVVRYRRSGAGRAVLLLHSHVASQPLWPEMLDLLASGGRLIVPAPPDTPEATHEWLALLLDGLGLWNVVLVATDGFCTAAIERALAEPDRIARIILACAGGADSVALETARSRLAGVPLLMLRPDQAASEVTPLVAAFVAAT